MLNRNKKSLSKYLIVIASIILFAIVLYFVWSPGRDIRDGRHDFSRNGIWLQHGWLGDDLWFVHNKREDKKAYFRNPENIRKLAALLRRHHRLLAAIKHMFTKACEWDMITEETLKRVHKVKFLQENNKRLRYLAKEECQSLINACDKHLKPIVIAALNTGMRRGEIFSLNWNNIDLKHGFILLEKTKNGDRREIPINDTLKRTLQGLERRLDIPSVFYEHSTGRPYTDIKHSFTSACRRAGILDFHFHDLRHTFFDNGWRGHYNSQGIVGS